MASTVPVADMQPPPPAPLVEVVVAPVVLPVVVVADVVASPVLLVLVPPPPPVPAVLPSLQPSAAAVTRPSVRIILSRISMALLLSENPGQDSALGSMRLQKSPDRRRRVA